MRGRASILLVFVLSSAAAPVLAAEVGLSLHVFDATLCKPEEKWAEYPVVYLSLSVIARDDVACWFRYRVEHKDTYEVRMCYVDAGPVVVSTLGPDRGDCFIERSGFIVEAGHDGWPPFVEEGGEISNGKREGTWIGFFDQDFVFPSYSVEYKGGRKNGEYRDTGGREHGLYRDDKKQGHWIEIASSPDRDDEGEYVDGKRDGRWVTHDWEDRVIFSTVYRAGRKNGPFTWSYADGTKREDGAYENDEKTGLWRSWNTKGVLLDSEEYERGKLHGWRRHWDFASGKLIYEQHYKRGVRDGFRKRQ